MPRPFSTTLIDWFAGNARDLPWRRDAATPWGVLVSEVMLQQTPVTRVLPAWLSWMDRWPQPAALAASTAGDAVRAWDRLGYPRRALRLHAAAMRIVQDHGGDVPAEVASLRALPGVGDYTAAAVASFAFGARVAVLDTNVRRVYARVFAGEAEATAAPTVAERADALARVPTDRPAAYSVAVMEFGALICRARNPHCGECPLAQLCAWRSRGFPAATQRRSPQGYDGTDRQARGRLLAVLREAPGPVEPAALMAAWADAAQRDRALAALVHDGLVERAGRRYRLPA